MNFKLLNKINDRNRKSHGVHGRLFNIDKVHGVCNLENKETRTFTEIKIEEIVKGIKDEQMHITNLSALRDLLNGG